MRCSDWPGLGHVPTCEFQRHGFEQGRVTDTSTTEIDLNGKGVVAPQWKIRVLLPKGIINAGQANITDVHCSMELERASVLWCPRTLTTQ